MKNQNNYLETVTLAIILGIIGSLFITGVYVWQEKENSQNFGLLISQLEKNNQQKTNPKTSQKNETLSCDDLFKKSRELEQSYNYCQTDSDCEFIGESWPFGCYYLKNKAADNSAYQALINEYKQQNCPPIYYDCYNPDPQPICQAGRCILK